ncbi:MAG: sulfatase-like hydrolase/transferase, partial [Deltaproteobacteria bacterium]|nr:sulfatase-like hydrolase/transferase [Deltaproteobacteria bacterium]
MRPRIIRRRAGRATGAVETFGYGWTMLVLVITILACAPGAPVEPPSASSPPTPGSPPTPPAPTTAPSPITPTGNVLVVVLDDVGVDKIGSYGFNPDAPSTPVFDALAAEGLRFTQAWAQPLCSPTRGSLLTGRHPRRFGIGDAIFDSETVLLPLSEVTIPEMLRAAPGTWTSSAVGKWHLAGTRAESYLDHPLDQGFDWAAGSPSNFQLDTVEGAVTHYMDWDKNTNGVLTRSSDYATTDTADDAIARIEAMPEPWFLYVAFNAGHMPMHVPPAELLSAPIGESATDAEKFGAMVEAADRELGRVLDALQPSVRERTTVFVVGDNGTSRHALDPAFESGHHKGTVYDAGVRVP